MSPHIHKSMVRWIRQEERQYSCSFLIGCAILPSANSLQAILSCAAPTCLIVCDILPRSTKLALHWGSRYFGIQSISSGQVWLSIIQSSISSIHLISVSCRSLSGKRFRCAAFSSHLLQFGQVELALGCCIPSFEHFPHSTVAQALFPEPQLIFFLV